MRKEQGAFTLIELLIVVAIIAILAAIAIPNFLEAQTRAKVSRVKNDMRTVATALEAYRVDNNKYPYPLAFLQGLGTQAYFIYTNYELTTPIAYLNSVEMRDPFTGVPPPEWGLKRQYFTYGLLSYGGIFYDVYIRSGKRRDAYALTSPGPSRMIHQLVWGVVDQSTTPFTILRELTPGGWNLVYDATNGTLSSGDIGRFGGDMSVPIN